MVEIVNYKITEIGFPDGPNSKCVSLRFMDGECVIDRSVSITLTSRIKGDIKNAAREVLAREFAKAAYELAIHRFENMAEIDKNQSKIIESAISAVVALAEAI